MPVVLDMPAELEERLHNAAAQQGVPPEVCAVRLLDQHLPPTDRQAAAEAWQRQYLATLESLSEEEMAANRQFLQEFDENRSSNRKLFREAVADEPQ